MLAKDIICFQSLLLDKLWFSQYLVYILFRLNTLTCNVIFDMEYPVDGVNVELLDENESYIKFHQKQHGYKRGFVRLMPYNQVMPKDYIKHAKRIHDFQIRDNDVWISSFPKCGRNYFTHILFIKWN